MRGQKIRVHHCSDNCGVRVLRADNKWAVVRARAAGGDGFDATSRGSSTGKEERERIASERRTERRGYRDCLGRMNLVCFVFELVPSREFRGVTTPKGLPWSAVDEKILIRQL